ncbi:MAG: hypothetical protein ACHP6H_06580 [Legionellales bacterium]
MSIVLLAMCCVGLDIQHQHLLLLKQPLKTTYWVVNLDDNEVVSLNDNDLLRFNDN